MNQKPHGQPAVVTTYLQKIYTIPQGGGLKILPSSESPMA